MYFESFVLLILIILVNVEASSINNSGGSDILRKSINIHAIGDEATLKNLNIAGYRVDELKERDFGWTSLTYAAHYGQIDAMDRLLRAGVDPNAVSAKNGWTALMHAASQGYVDGVELMLMQRQINILQKSDDGKTAQAIALESEQPMISKFIAEAALTAAISTYDKATITSMLNLGAFVDTRNSVGYTALLMACRKDDLSMVRDLLDTYGADVNNVDNDGWGCLMFASMRNDGDMAMELLAHGANPMTRTHSGHTARSCAVSKKHNSMVSLLADHTNRMQALQPQAGGQGAIGAVAGDKQQQQPLLLQQQQMQRQSNIPAIDQLTKAAALLLDSTMTTARSMSLPSLRSVPEPRPLSSLSSDMSRSTSSSTNPLSIEAAMTTAASAASSATARLMEGLSSAITAVDEFVTTL